MPGASSEASIPQGFVLFFCLLNTPPGRSYLHKSIKAKPTTSLPFLLELPYIRSRKSEGRKTLTKEKHPMKHTYFYFAVVYLNKF